MTTARQAAATILLALGQRKTTLAAEVERGREGLTDRRDRALLVELAAGTLRWKAELDAIIAGASGRRLADIEARALVVLELGVYQWRHLERIPTHAIVNESVNTIRALGAPRAAGFVNAVLRNLLRRKGSLPLPARPGPNASESQRLVYLSTTLSHPEWLVKRWLRRYGFEHTAAWCTFNNASPELTLRPRMGGRSDALIDQLRNAGVDGAVAARYARDAVRLPPGGLGQTPLEILDDVVVQDEGSQLVARMAEVRPGERVFDVCASPGGKTLVMADDLAGGADASLLVASDRRPARVALLRRLTAEAPSRIHVLAADALVPLPFAAEFDCVLLDVPCSGLGTLRRDPDLKWSRQESELASLAADARRMLANAAEVVRPGGRLIYATCSSEPDENEDVISAFLAADRRFTPRAAAASSSVPASLLDERGYLATTPFAHGLDAYFAAVLVRSPAA